MMVVANLVGFVVGLDEIKDMAAGLVRILILVVHPLMS
jgi:hypothetical protein